MKSLTAAQVRRPADPSRRGFLLTTAAGLALAAIGPGARAGAGETVTIESFSPAGKSLGTARVEKIAKSDQEWRKQLSAEAFRVARQAGTEQSYSGVYWDNHADGLYRCVCCDTALFDSKTKYDSGTGWPSFWRPISDMNVAEERDTTLGMVRTAVACKRCDAHLGHVFDDGPQPTGLRYCMNSVSLNFVARG